GGGRNGGDLEGLEQQSPVKDQEYAAGNNEHQVSGRTLAIAEFLARQAVEQQKNRAQQASIKDDVVGILTRFDNEQAHCAHHYHGEQELYQAFVFVIVRQNFLPFFSV